jgi:hypothetical protein
LALKSSAMPGLGMRSEFLCGDLGDNRENPDEDEARDGIAEVHRHRNRVAAGFAERRRQYLDDSEYERDLRNLAAFDILVHAAIFPVCGRPSASRYLLLRLRSPPAAG